MRIVVTGATGNVGTSVVDALLADSEVDSVLGIARRRPELPDGLEFASADVARDDLGLLFQGADAVIHLAWAIQPSRDGAALRSTNVDGSRRVAAAVAEAGVSALIYASSVGAYSPGPVDGHMVDESWPTGGIETSFYSRHKAEVERMLDSFEVDNPGTRVVRLRPALIFKADAGAEIRRLFAGPLLPSPLVAPRRLPAFPWVRGLSTQVVHSSDVGRAYALAARSDLRGAFNLAAEPAINAATLRAALGKRVIELPAAPVRSLAAASWRLRLQPTPEGWFDMGMKSPLMSTARALSELGWAPEHPAGSTFVELLEGLAGSQGLPTPPLEPHAGGRLRFAEFLSGIGASDRADR